MRKATGSYRTYSSRVKLQPRFLSLQWKTCLWAELRPLFLSLRWRTCSWAEYYHEDDIRHNIIIEIILIRFLTNLPQALKFIYCIGFRFEVYVVNLMTTIKLKNFYHDKTDHIYLLNPWIKIHVLNRSQRFHKWLLEISVSCYIHSKRASDRHSRLTIKVQIKAHSQLILQHRDD